MNNLEDPREPERPCAIAQCPNVATVKITLDSERCTYLCDHCTGQIAVAIASVMEEQ